MGTATLANNRDPRKKLRGVFIASNFTDLDIDSGFSAIALISRF
jgi:hypothetical protein